MLSAYEESGVRLERLLELAVNATDPIRRDELAVEIRLVLDERERMRSTMRQAQADRNSQ